MEAAHRHVPVLQKAALPPATPFSQGCLNTSAHEAARPQHTSPCHLQRHLPLSPPTTPPFSRDCKLTQMSLVQGTLLVNTITTHPCQLCCPHRPCKPHAGICPLLGEANLFCSGHFHNTSPQNHYLVHKHHCSHTPATSTNGRSTRASAPSPAKAPTPATGPF